MKFKDDFWEGITFGVVFVGLIAVIIITAFIGFFWAGNVPWYMFLLPILWYIVFICLAICIMLLIGIAIIDKRAKK